MEAPIELLDKFLDLGDTCRAADEKDLVDVGSLEACIPEGCAARLDGPLEQVVAELLELGPGKGLYKMLGDTVHRHDVREVDLRGSLVG